MKTPIMIVKVVIIHALMVVLELALAFVMIVKMDFSKIPTQVTAVLVFSLVKVVKTLQQIV